MHSPLTLKPAKLISCCISSSALPPSRNQNATPHNSCNAGWKPNTKTNTQSDFVALLFQPAFDCTSSSATAKSSCFGSRSGTSARFSLNTFCLRNGWFHWKGKTVRGMYMQDVLWSGLRRTFEPWNTLGTSGGCLEAAMGKKTNSVHVPVVVNGFKEDDPLLWTTDAVLSTVVEFE
jgi:hypothetical protein